MGNQEKKNRWQDEDIKKMLQKSAEEEKIPESLKPEQMEQWLQQAVSKKERITGKRENDNKKYRNWWIGTVAAAACLAGVVFAAGRDVDFTDTDLSSKDASMVKEETAAVDNETEKGTTYQELYQSFSDTWKKQSAVITNEMTFDTAAPATSEGTAGREEVSGEAVDMNSDAHMMVDADEAADGAADYSVPSAGGTEESSNTEYGKTNQQETDVEEADIIKNDGRYLYQVILKEQYYDGYAVQIVDTDGGLKETARVGDYESVDDIYVWNDTLVILETGWTKASAAGVQDQGQGTEEKGLLQGVESLVDDVAYINNAYSRIHVYDIKDRTNPQEYHTFTLRGEYKDSRISDGYLYFFSRYYTQKPKNEDDYEAYIPIINDRPMKEDSIYLPNGTASTSYLVMASVNMSQPDTFTDHCAIVTNADRFYVSRDNIYIAECNYIDYAGEGQQFDSTHIYRFSYKKGRMQKEAEGSVKGTLRDDMALNEYKGYLRMVTTVESQNVREVIDDITGETIGYDSHEYEMSNSLYILDADLKVKGRIEDLAKGERVYAARFMGNTGYFVTFRETDPLFSVDLSDPDHPKILGELKISGFSEYLHFYADNLLLGIGMEADENSGATEGMKLSMFDISNPMDVQEKSKMDLSRYSYADALYDYKSVLIDTEKNLFGFYAEGYDYENDYQVWRSYLLFTYENGEFRQIMDIDCSDYEQYGYYRIRGTYIGGSFYLMCVNGRIEEYSLTDGSKTGELPQ